MIRTSAGAGWWIFLAALLLRVGWVGYDWTRNGARLAFDDEQLHWQIATNLVQTGEFATADGRRAARMPLYPLLLAPFAALGPAGVLAARLAQAVLGAIVARVAYGLGRQIAGPRAGIAAGLLAALDPFATFLTNLLLNETLFALLLLGLTAGAWALAEAGTHRARRLAGGLALLATAAVLTRPEALAFVVVLAALIASGAATRTHAPRVVLLTAAALLVALGAWGFRNWRVLGAPALLGANGGVTLYDGQGPQARGDSNQAFLLSMPELNQLDEVARDRELRRRALEQMRADPARVLALAATKFGRMWNFVPNVAEYRSGVAPWISAGFMAAVLALAAAGAVRLRAQPRALLLLLAPLVLFTLVYCIYVGSVRYRVPLLPLLEVLAAAAFLNGRPAAPDAPSAGPRPAAP
jgi:4-amino-4-deoxy-L-arabinose transferase-like glycosyltransferase